MRGRDRGCGNQMKVLYVGWHHPRMIAMTDYLEYAFAQVGYDVKQFNYRQYRIPGIIRDRFSFIQELDLKYINHKLIAEAKKFMPDVLFVLQGETIFPETALTIKKILGVTTVNWFIDPTDILRALAIKIAPGYDFFFSSSSTMVNENHSAGNNNVRFLPYACDPNTNLAVSVTNEEKSKYEHDVVFVGSHYPERESVLASLASEFDIGIWGPGWENSKLKEYVHGGLLYPQEWTKVYSCAKIVLNIPYGLKNFTNTFVQPTIRIFEALACGAFVLTDDNPDIRTIFEIGKHLETYSNINELKNRLRIYLKDTEKREAIGRTGKEEVLAKHTYAQRLKEIFSILGANT
jgi:spore maturation protein CgeB